jgi:hypothetical protein
MTERLIPLIVEALRTATMNPGEHRLYRAGKTAGLFPNRAGISGEAAQEALRAGLLEEARAEVRGKSIVQWVRATPLGIQFLQEKESPLSALNDLRELIKGASSALPPWAASLGQKVDSLCRQLQEEAAEWTKQLGSMGQRVEEALRRHDLARTKKPAAGLGASVLAYLDRRAALPMEGACTLPELFSAVQGASPGLSIKAFHEELLRLRDAEAIQLIPFSGGLEELPEPEYALPEGSTTYWQVAR